MTKSRKNQKRNKKKHYKQLKSQCQRRSSREAKQYTPYKFGFGTSIKAHKKEIALFGLMMAGILFVYLSGPDKKAMNDIKASVSSKFEFDSFYWEDAYPYGYKVIALTDTDIIHTDYDTLPKDLRINWKDLSVVRIQDREYGSMEEKIELGINGVYYAPAGVSGRSITATLLRKKGSSVVLTRLGKLEFVAEIVAEEKDQVFCLFGLR